MRHGLIRIGLSYNSRRQNNNIDGSPIRAGGHLAIFRARKSHLDNNGEQVKFRRGAIDRAGRVHGYRHQWASACMALMSSAFGDKAETSHLAMHLGFEKGRIAPYLLFFVMRASYFTVHFAGSFGNTSREGRLPKSRASTFSDRLISTVLLWNNQTTQY